MTREAQTPYSPRPAETLAFWRDFLMVGGLTAAILYFAKGVLIPLSIAMLIFVLLTSVIDRIASMKIGGRPVPSWLAHVGGLAIVLVSLAAILSILSSQAQEVGEAIPRYQERFSGILARVVTVIGEDNTEALLAAMNEIEVSAIAADTANSAGSFLSGLFLVLLYIPFMMVERKPMKKKVAIAAADPELGSQLDRAMRSISIGLQQYVGIKTLVSALTGLLSYAVMKLVGLDFAETWAVLAFALNFIPTIGSILGVVLPAIVALVQFDTMGPFLIVVLGCGLVQFVVGNVLEPSLAGKKLNLSPMMMILSLTLWSALWGIPGAFLSVPIMVCVLIILSHIPGARWAAILMSGDGKLRSNLGEDAAPPVEEAAPPEKPHSRPEPGPAIQGVSD